MNAPHAGRRSRRKDLRVLAVVALLVSVSPLPAEDHYSFVLTENTHASNPELDGIDRNSILTYDDVTELAKVTSTRLADALIALSSEARVDALSYGLDVGGLNDHTYFFFSVSLTSEGHSSAVAKTPLDDEPPSECQSDLYFIKDVEQLNRIRSTHRKVMDENDASPVPPQRARPEPPTLGLTGTYGSPRDLAPDVANVSGFDLNTHDDDYDIYFSVDRPVPFSGACAGRNYFSPADIIAIDPTGVISCFKSAEDLGLDPDQDDIDALALNLRGWGLPPGVRSIGWYSVTRDSAALTTYDHAAGDIFQFIPASTYSTPPLHIRSEWAGLLSRFSIGTGPVDIDADIDSISAVDPIAYFSGPTGQPSPITVEVPEQSPITVTYGWVVDGLQASIQEATDPLFSVTPQDGDFLSVEAVGYRGRFESWGNERSQSPGDLEGVTDIEVSVVGGDVTWSWSNPTPNPYDQISIQVDDNPPIPLGPIDTFFTEPGLAPGSHRARIQGFGIGGVSEVRYSSAFVPAPPTAPSVERLAAIEVALGQFEVTWINPVAYDGLEVLVDGNVAVTVPPVSAGSASTADVSIAEGRATISVRGSVGTASSVASAVSVTHPPRQPGSLIAQRAAAPPISDMTVDLDGLLYVLDGSGVAQVYDPFFVGPPFAQRTPPAPGFVEGIAFGSLGVDAVLFWAIDGQLHRTDVLGGNPQFLGPLDLPGGGPVRAIAFEGNGLWVADAASGIVTRHDPNNGAFTGEQFDLGGDAIVGIAGRLGQPGVLQVLHVDLDFVAHVSVVETDGTGIVTIPTDVGPDPLAVAWSPFGAHDGPSFHVAEATGSVAEIHAIAQLPSPDRRNCHDFVGTETGFASAGTSPIPDGLPFGLQTTIEVTSLAGVVADLDVSLRIEHERVGELDVFLMSPGGSTVQLYAGESGTEREVDRIIDDASGPGSFNDGFGTRTPSGTEQLATFDGESPNGEWVLTVVDDEPGRTGTLEEWSLSFCVDATPPTVLFERGDCNTDGAFNIADAITTLDVLFSGGATSCVDACDANDDGGQDIGDAVFILNALFQAGPLPPAPFGSCGADPTADGLGCDSNPSCP